MRLLTGGYTADMQGSATGIGMLLAGDADAVLAGGPLGFAGQVAAADSPSWVTAHPTLPIVYAALEGQGAVQAFERTGEASLRPLADPVTVGDLACHVAVAPDGGALLVACWGDGRVVRVKLDATGRPATVTTAPAARDPYAPRAESGPTSPAADADDVAAAAHALREVAGSEYAHLIPGGTGQEQALLELSAARAEAGLEASSRSSHAHQSRYLPAELVATTDMGFDLVRLWRVSAEGLRVQQSVVLPRGSGPRHTVWHPSGHLYVITELSHEVFVLAPDAAGSWSIRAAVSLGTGILPDDTAAELAMSRDGGHLYAGVRGSNTIATLRVRGDGSHLEPVALVEAGVDWPRHHVVVRDTLLVAGQLSDEVASLALDERTGVPGRVRQRADVPSPTCLLPLH